MVSKIFRVSSIIYFNNFSLSLVFEILVRWLECKDWGKSFLEVIPQRKFNTIERKKRQENNDVNSTSLQYPECEGNEKSCDE
jgi:hypothetical protein